MNQTIFAWLLRSFPYPQDGQNVCVMCGVVSPLPQIEELFNLEIKGFDGLVINVNQAQLRQDQSAQQICF